MKGLSWLGSKEFREYADNANIPNSYRIWAYAMWQEAQKQAAQNTIHNSSLMSCPKCKEHGAIIVKCECCDTEIDLNYQE